MITMGIDASTKCTGYCIFDNKKLIKYDKISPDKTLEWRDRVVWMMKHLSDIARDNSVEQICVEVPVKTIQNVNTLEQLFSLHGAILGFASSLGIPVIPVEVATWRKEVGISLGISKGMNKRDILKQRSIEKVNELYGLELVWKSPSSKYNDDDISDSILIAHSVLNKSNKRFK